MSQPAAGVIRQMAEEANAAREANIAWTARFFVPAGVEGEVCVNADISAKNRLAFKKAYYRWLLDESCKHDVILLRHSPYDPLEIAFLRAVQKRVFLVHHTLEVPEILSNSGAINKLKALMEHSIGASAMRRAFGMIGVTREIVEYEKSRTGPFHKPAFIYPNGISYNNGQLAEDHRSKVPELLFTASVFANWHGVDMLVKSALRSSRDFKLHLVGDCPWELKNLAKDDERLIFHGQMGSLEISRIMNACWAGLSSFALFRKNMKEACTLKVREYLRSGLPVYAGHEDVFPASARFYRNGACDMDSIIDFATTMRHDTRDVISAAARPFISKKEILEKLYGQISESVTTSR